MDNSQEYIKMCQEAEEIQKLKRFSVGDYLSENNHILLVRLPDEASECLLTSMIPRGETYYLLPSSLAECIWLPRQDQLQEMLQTIETPARVIWCVGCWANHNKYAEQFHSMEQLWLTFVMLTLYHKKWENGENWVLLGENTGTA